MARDDLRRATRSRVLVAADQLFTERGFRATTIRDVAAQSGVSVGTVMSVGDKNALLVQIFDDLIAAGQSEDQVSDAPSTDPAQQILALVEPFIALFTRRAELARTYAAILVSGHHASTLVTDLAGPLIEQIEVVLTRSRGRRPARPGDVARAVYFAYVGVLFSWASRADAEPRELPGTVLGTISAIIDAPDDTQERPC